MITNDKIFITIFLISIFLLYGFNLYRTYRQTKQHDIQGVKKKLNKPEIPHRLCKMPQCTKFFFEIGCLGTDNVV